jgi:hypothetical protein
MARARWGSRAAKPQLQKNPRLPFPRILSAKSITPVWNRLPPRFSSADSCERRMSSPLVVVRSSLFVALSWTDMSLVENPWIFEQLKEFWILGVTEFDGEFVDL